MDRKTDGNITFFGKRERERERETEREREKREKHRQTRISVKMMDAPKFHLINNIL